MTVTAGHKTHQTPQDSNEESGGTRGAKSQWFQEIKLCTGSFLSHSVSTFASGEEPTEKKNFIVGSVHEI